MGYANQSAGELRAMMAKGELPPIEPGPAVEDMKKGEDPAAKINEILASLRIAGLIEES